jgi:hypothetical protein
MVKRMKQATSVVGSWPTAGAEIPEHRPGKISGLAPRPTFAAMKRHTILEEGTDPSDPALENEDTAVMKLSPAFLQALRAIAPKKRRSKLPYVCALALVTIIAVLARDRSTRDFVAAHWHQYRGGAAALASPVAALPVVSTPPSAPVPAAVPTAAATADIAVVVTVARPAPLPSASTTGATAIATPKADRRGAQRASVPIRH